MRRQSTVLVIAVVTWAMLSSCRREVSQTSAVKDHANPTGASTAQDEMTAEPEVVQQVILKRGALEVVFRDNSTSPRVLSGIQSLRHRSAAEFDAFDPDSPGASAGLNFEHIISGHLNAHNKFTPRHGPYRLERVSDTSARLVRHAADSPWRVSSTLTYTLREPSAIDFEFRCRVHEPELFGARGYAVFFFANYMNDVEDVALHFRGVDAPGEEERWIAADAPGGHRHWNQGGTYRHVDAAPLEYDDDVSFNLNTWSYDGPFFTAPFYYGRAANNMVYLIMFDRAVSELDQIRFSLFKFKLRNFPRPAWDFQYVIHRVKSEQEYGFRARVVWKKFISPEDCQAEFERWRQTLK